MNLNNEGEKSWKIECGLLYRPFNMKNVCSQHHHWKRPPFRKKKRSRHLEEQCLTQMAFQDYYLLLERMGTWFHYLLRPGSASRHMLWTCFVMLVSSHGPKSRDGGMSNSPNVQRRAWPRLFGCPDYSGMHVCSKCYQRCEGCHGSTDRDGRRVSDPQS